MVEELLTPDPFAVEHAISIFGITIGLLFAAIHQRSPTALFAWIVVLLSLVFSITLGTDLLYFWLTIVLNGFLIVNSEVIAWLFGARV